MVDPSVAATMDGGANRVCVGRHARDAVPTILQFYAFRCLNHNLSVPHVPHRLDQSSREKEMLRKFLRDEGGATAIEYSLIAGFIALAIIAAVGMTGERLVALLEGLATALSL
ncbi:Flp family type IVb pilin [Bradyrhizobium sp. AZCC 1721]|uniref:Flp family type IVb pilin n=1 Tax=Bradyrhizobium sp. AZCC 1721 TaxID=3117016 RepID=UPI002FF2D954